MSLSREELEVWVRSHTCVGEGIDVLKNDCERIVFLLDNCDMVIPEGNRFFVRVNCEGIADTVTGARWRPYSSILRTAGLSDGADALAYTGSYDLSHTSAEWESVMTLGIYGLRERIAEYARGAADSDAAEFYGELLKVYGAALRFMERASRYAAQCGKEEMASSLAALAHGRPTSLYGALQTSLVYYTLQQFLDGTCLRTLGRLDGLLYPYYVKMDKVAAERMLIDYIHEADRFEAIANIPFAIGGTDESGKDLMNELSYVLLDAYKKAEVANTKLHILCSEHTPRDIIERAFRYIREGSNGIVFMSDGRVIEALERSGVEHSDAVRYHVVGCYECGGEGELTCSCNARVNVPKALELALNGGRDMLTGGLIGLQCEARFETYDELWAEFKRQLEHLCSCAMKATELCEEHYPQLHSSPFLSGTYRSALERGGDLYRDHAAKYNSSSLNAVGLATAADSLAAIRKAVFEDGALTLSELVGILRSDWEGREPLRLLIKNKYPKFGQGDASVDSIAADTVDVISRAVSGKPNSKGGHWRLGLFSIDWRWEFGKRTAASADGRRSGETLSQNTSATFGADKEGATAHLLSVSRIDASKTPNGAIVDIDLHSSAVRGENGIKALVTSLLAYFKLGGLAVHYNVLDTDVLIAAKREPAKYPTLQVRLCGWNVLFSSLSEAEKDEFIRRSRT